MIMRWIGHLFGYFVTRRFWFLGLIGSATKRARFVRRLRQAGVAPEQLDRLVCPIGIAEISGKAPDMVALSVSAQLAILAAGRQQSPAFIA